METGDYEMMLLFTASILLFVSQPVTFAWDAPVNSVPWDGYHFYIGTNVWTTTNTQITVIPPLGWNAAVVYAFNRYGDGDPSNVLELDVRGASLLRVQRWNVGTLITR